MNKRKMIVTVGTSLLSSASWRPDGESNPFSSITAYPQWAATNARTDQGSSSTRVRGLAKGLVHRH
jgi:hypothetical protein